MFAVNNAINTSSANGFWGALTNVFILNRDSGLSVLYSAFSSLKAVVMLLLIAVHFSLFVEIGIIFLNKKQRS
jgi:hypothetical protein